MFIGSSEPTARCSGSRRKRWGRVAGPRPKTWYYSTTLKSGGSAAVIGRNAPRSLYRTDIVTFEDDRGAYDQRDAGGFIRLNALRLRTTAMAMRGR